MGLLLLIYGLTGAHRKKPAADTSLATAPSSYDPSTLLQSLGKKYQKSESVGVDTPESAGFREKILDIESQEDMDVREQLIASLVGSIASADIQLMLSELERMGQKQGQPDLIGDIRLCLIRRWAQLDASAASAWVQQLPEGAMRQECLAGVAIEWANTNLSDAVAWGQQLTEPSEKEKVLSEIASEAVRLDPIVALRLAANLPVDERRKDLVQRSAQEWAAVDGEQAVTWARQIQDELLRTQVLSAMAVAIGEKDPESAATLAVTEIPAGRMQSDAVIGIIERWAQQQPRQAAAWVAEFPESSLKTTAIENVVAMWSLSDAQGAERWREQMKVAE